MAVISKVLIWISVFSFTFLSNYVYAKSEDGQCPIYGAEYVPQENQQPKNLEFILRITKGDGSNHTRTIFLNFDTYDNEGNKVSSMRLSNTHSNGLARESFSTSFGVFCDLLEENDDCKPPEKDAGFFPIGLDAKLKKQSIYSAPDLIIFPETYAELTYGSYRFPDDWDKYIQFFTETKTYPDFRGYDFWVRKKCGDSN